MSQEESASPARFLAGKKWEMWLAVSGKSCTEKRFCTTVECGLRISETVIGCCLCIVDGTTWDDWHGWDRAQNRRLEAAETPATPMCYSMLWLLGCLPALKFSPKICMSP